MHTPTRSLAITSAACVLAAALALGCGSGRSTGRGAGGGGAGGGGGGGAGGGGAGGGAGGGGGGGGGAAAETAPATVDATIEDQDGQSRDIDRSEAAPSRDSFGAILADDLITLWILGSDGSLLTFYLPTEGEELPSAFTLTDDVSGAYGTLTEVGPPPAAYVTQSGKIDIDTCPQATGDAITGEFDSIVFSGIDAAGATITRKLEGRFETRVVEARNAAVACKPVEQPAEGEGEPGEEGEGEPGGQCQWNKNTMCTTPQQAPCCPFIEAVGGCVMGCAFGDCMNPENVEGCAQCMDACVRNHADAACEPKWLALSACQRDSGCEQEDDACMAAACCDEAGAAFGHN